MDTGHHAMRHGGARRGSSRRLAGVWALVAAAALLAACGGAAGPAPSARPSTYTVALSNSFIGNEWRQTMVKTFEDAAKQAVANGDIKSYSVVNDQSGSATEQISQIQALILKGVNALVIDSASETALNPVIGQACAKGIRVVVFDSLASAPCAYKVGQPFFTWGQEEAQSVVDALHGQGNILVVQGVVGSLPNQQIYNGQMSVIKKYPGIKVLGQPVGQGSQTVAQQAVAQILPGLPPIQGVVCYAGGDAMGVSQAFNAAGRPAPVVNFSNLGTELRFWKQQGPSFSAVSISSTPGQASFALWEAVDLLQGGSAPQNITLPLLKITSGSLDQWIAVTPEDEVATPIYTQKETRDIVALDRQQKSLPDPSVPSHAP